MGRARAQLSNTVRRARKTSCAIDSPPRALLVRVCAQVHTDIWYFVHAGVYECVMRVYAGEQVYKYIYEHVALYEHRLT